jgi:hypothetical protein
VTRDSASGPGRGTPALSVASCGVSTRCCGAGLAGFRAAIPRLRTHEPRHPPRKSSSGARRSGPIAASRSRRTRDADIFRSNGPSALRSEAFETRSVSGRLFAAFDVVREVDGIFRRPGGCGIAAITTEDQPIDADSRWNRRDRESPKFALKSRGRISDGSGRRCLMKRRKI